jgi:hypothetical protein
MAQQMGIDLMKVSHSSDFGIRGVYNYITGHMQSNSNDPKKVIKHNTMMNNDLRMQGVVHSLCAFLVLV